MTTNYERIKNMTLEEMQQMFYYMSRGLDSCCQCPVNSKCIRFNSSRYGVRPTCKEMWKQWLERESENEHWLEVGYDE